MTVRIAKFIADTGAASRRAAEDLIASRRVTVNGTVIDSPVFFVSDGDVVAIDGVPIGARAQTELYAFHKPLNTMTTARDPRGRKTIYDVLPDEYKNLKYVGRLDYKTTGLLLMTNDGALARKLTLPSSHIPRTYLATVNTSDFSGLDAARRGITVDGVSYRPMQIDVLKNGELRVTVTEGKKNEVRIVLRACGAPVRKLHRVSFGNIELGKLPVGKIRIIPQKTIDALLNSF
ncbi:MAG TPA: pseudouridine synthase [Alphaproteobacteria bacterium]|nr:pseudouridine synthase [Alphaproteobacteria bacterium]HBS76647.1 pseudouridine synthase [Alphaproteobacteria bacterium]